MTQTRACKMPLSKIFRCLLIVIAVLTNARFSFGTNSKSGRAFAVFLKHGNRYLDAPNHRLSESLVVDDFACSMICLRNPHCNSYNFGKMLNLNDLKTCELLSTTISINPKKLRTDLQFDHWLIEVRKCFLALEVSIQI